MLRFSRRPRILRQKDTGGGAGGRGKKRKAVQRADPKVTKTNRLFGLIERLGDYYKNQHREGASLPREIVRIEQDRKALMDELGFRNEAEVRAAVQLNSARSQMSEQLRTPRKRKPK